MKENKLKKLPVIFLFGKNFHINARVVITDNFLRLFFVLYN